MTAESPPSPVPARVAPRAPPRSGIGENQVLEMSDRLRRLRPAFEQPGPLELGSRRGCALPSSADNFVEQRERGTLLQGVEPGRHASGQEQEVRPPPAPTFPRCQAGSRKPQGRDGAERVTL